MRLKREHEMLSKLGEFSIEVEDSKSMDVWLVHFECPADSIYRGEKYT